MVLNFTDGQSSYQPIYQSIQSFFGLELFMEFFQEKALKINWHTCTPHQAEQYLLAYTTQIHSLWQC